MLAATQARLAATHTTEDSIGRGLFEVFPDDAHGLRASLERVLATRAADSMAVQKYDIRRPDGTFHERYCIPINAPVLAASGEIRYILHRVEDVTEVVARSHELARGGQQRAGATPTPSFLGELDVAKTAFFSSTCSHEFRTPLMLLLGPIEDALADATDELSKRQRPRIKLAYGQRAALAQARQRATRLLEPRGLPHARHVRADRSRGIHRRARVDVRIRRRAHRGQARGRLPAGRRADLDRSRHVGEDRAEPRRQRLQVHERRRDRRAAARPGELGRARGQRYGRRDRARRGRPTSSSASIAAGTSAGARGTRARASACRSSASWSRCITATSPSTASKAKAARFASRFPKASPISRPTRCRKRRCAPACGEPHAPTSPKPRAGNRRPMTASRCRARARRRADCCDHVRRRRRQCRCSRLASRACKVDGVRGDETAIDRAAALESVREQLPDIVVADVMMPAALDGFGLVRERCATIRAPRRCR